MARHGLRLSLALAIAASFVAPAWAGDVGQCIKASAGEYKECKADCKETYQTAKDACSNKDHVCVEACREERAECREATGFDAEIAACNAERDAAILACNGDDACIDGAQLAAFQCRDQVREANKDELKACRSAFNACREACPPGAGPVEDPTTCKLEAKGAYKACRAECREDFQIEKDACRNRDHDCVEDCRATRETCKADVQDSLDADLAVCKAAKDIAIAGCNGDDACIDLAQSGAFICRDGAHEAARPGFQVCRQAFKACVLVCPPATP